QQQGSSALSQATVLTVSPANGSFAALAQLAAPSQLAVDAANNLYVLDSGNGRVRKIELTTSPRVGTFSQIASGGGWNTSITLINLSAVAITAHVAFYSDTGTRIVLPLALPTGSHVTDSDADVTIQPR